MSVGPNFNAFNSSYRGGILTGISPIVEWAFMKKNECEACEGWGFKLNSPGPMKTCPDCLGTGRKTLAKPTKRR